ncbi:uncharacterized protein LOC111049609 [Nilaparvata lugens]|uniref:uncharacterized protein LOC111049609 n=1 Tax=Nilaparvata lugens TaxID=108931 RepID=UPI00193E9F98|nr:uncharacterized protein LOC111049609 [Nilaparvata lugens]
MSDKLTTVLAHTVLAFSSGYSLSNTEFGFSTIGLSLYFATGVMGAVIYGLEMRDRHLLRVYQDIWSASYMCGFPLIALAYNMKYDMWPMPALMAAPLFFEAYLILRGDMLDAKLIHLHHLLAGVVNIIVSMRYNFGGCFHNALYPLATIIYGETPYPTTGKRSLNWLVITSMANFLYTGIFQ